MDTIITIGNFSIKWYSVLIIIGILIGYIGINRESKRFGVDNNFVFNLIFWCVLFGVIGARIYYVLFNLDYYIENINEIYKVWNGGLAIHGGLIIGIIVIILYSHKYKINSLKMFDIFAPFVILAQAIGRWGNFFNKEAYGSLTTLEFLQKLHIPSFIINGMYINGNYYLPMFLFESIWCLIVFIILIIIRRIKIIKTGQIFSLYLMFYSVGRFFIESFRTDSLMLGNYKVAQLISVLMFIVGFVIFVVSIKISKRYNEKGEK